MKSTPAMRVLTDSFSTGVTSVTITSPTSALAVTSPVVPVIWRRPTPISAAMVVCWGTVIVRLTWDARPVLPPANGPLTRTHTRSPD